MRLSPHFTLEELTHSDTATRLGFDNTPDEDIIDNLTFLASQLEHVRSILNYPILVSSGFRCHDLNDHLGSNRTSKHTQGLACDFICPSFGSPRDICDALIAANIGYDQIILEFDRWVHIAFTEDEPRQQALIIDKQGTREYN